MKITEWFKVAGQFIKTTSKSVVRFVKLNAKVVSIVTASTVVGVTTVTVGTVHIVQNNNEKNQPQSVAVTGLTVNTQTVELEVGETYAKCEEEGTGRYTYKKDGQTFTFDVVIPELQHNYGNWAITTEPTKNSTGVITKTCVNNPAHKQTANLPALNKTDYGYSKTKTEDCDNTGTEEYVYNKDGQNLKIEVTVPKLGHSYGAWVLTGTPTGSTTGTLTKTCANNAGHTETFPLPILKESNGYSYSVIEPAKCEEEGKGRYTYNKDGQSFTFDVDIDAINHNYTKTPTWTWNGYSSATAKFVCQNDTAHIENKAATITSSITEVSTCIKGGTRTYTATVSFGGSNYTDIKTETLAIDEENHANLSVTGNFSECEGGKKNLRCKSCKDSWSETLTATGHNYVNGKCTKCNADKPTNDFKTEYIINGDDTVTVTIKLTGVVKVAGFNLTIQYDANVLYLDSTQQGAFSVTENTETEGQVVLVHTNSASTTTAGTVLTLTFAIDSSENTEIKLTVNEIKETWYDNSIHDTSSTATGTTIILA